MYIKVVLTTALMSKVQKRLQHHTSQYLRFEGSRGVFNRNAKNPHEEKLRMYEQLDKLANPFSGLQEYAGEVYMTPTEAHELLRTVYAFEITAQHIALPTDKISVSHLTGANFAPVPADSAAEAPPPPKPRRKDYPTF